MGYTIRQCNLWVLRARFYFAQWHNSRGTGTFHSVPDSPFFKFWFLWCILLRVVRENSFVVSVDKYLKVLKINYILIVISVFKSLSKICWYVLHILSFFQLMYECQLQNRAQNWEQSMKRPKNVFILYI